MICYSCGKELVDKKAYLENKDKFLVKPALKHNEHIIQNSLIGKLKSSEILCEDCGNILNVEIDANFSQIFEVFTEQLRGILAPKDHGDNKGKILKGYLYLDKSLNEKFEIELKDFQASPKNPFYKIDDEHKIIKIYANKKRAKQFRHQINKELELLGYDLNEYKLEYITDFANEGILGLFFSEGIENFSEKFYLGLNKIATGFASYHRIDRTELPRSLNISTGRIIHSNNIFPFFPLGSFDLLYECNRPELEPLYPTHTLILFTAPTQRNKSLYCYIDLFSTFQYYVILNDNYQGDDMYEVYSQSILKQEFPAVDVRRIKPKLLLPFIEWSGIDNTKYVGNSINDLYDYVEAEYKKLKLDYNIDFSAKLETIASKLIISYSIYDGDIDSPKYKTIVKSFDAISQNQIPSFLAEVKNFIEKDTRFFRRFFYENDGYDDIELLVTPYETMVEFAKNAHIMDTPNGYGQLKFQQLAHFIEQTSPETFVSEQEEINLLLVKKFFGF